MISCSKTSIKTGNACPHRKYLKDESMQKKGQTYDMSDWILENVTVRPSYFPPKTLYNQEMPILKSLV